MVAVAGPKGRYCWALDRADSEETVAAHGSGTSLDLLVVAEVAPVVSECRYRGSAWVVEEVAIDPCSWQAEEVVLGNRQDQQESPARKDKGKLAVSMKYFVHSLDPLLGAVGLWSVHGSVGLEVLAEVNRTKISTQIENDSEGCDTVWALLKHS